MGTRIGGSSAIARPTPQQPAPRRRSTVKIAAALVGVAILGFALVAACTAVLTSGGGQPTQHSTVTATARNNSPDTGSATGNVWPPPQQTGTPPTGNATTFQIPFPSIQLPTRSPQPPPSPLEVPGLPFPIPVPQAHNPHPDNGHNPNR
ncbi:hypothetical protein [Nocardia sp. BMG51109]|uniref:hypothetical protein n=1 Tax=Nocardia sp. BMG51109 TaxID=1056816 RepID=UPI00046792BD|nr:hypothetical protein [Nocardia sp. BMG51109]